MRFEVSHASFSYGPGRDILQDVNFAFDCRGVMSVLGPNGAGKSTLMKCMLGLLPWTHGATKIDGRDIRSIPPRTLFSRIGYVPQAKPGNFVYSVRDLVLMGRSARLGLFSQPGKADQRAADAAMDRVGILGIAGELCNEISGGQYQLALIARALCSEPELLVLDEPESNLDFANQLKILCVIRELTQNEGIGAVMITHFPEHAIELSSRALLMQKNAAPLYGPAEEILTEENLSESYGVTVRILPVDESPRPCVVAIEEESAR